MLRIHCWLDDDANCIFSYVHGWINLLACLRSSIVSRMTSISLLIRICDCIILASCCSGCRGLQQIEVVAAISSIISIKSHFFHIYLLQALFERVKKGSCSCKACWIVDCSFFSPLTHKNAGTCESRPSSPTHIHSRTEATYLSTAGANLGEPWNCVSTKYLHLHTTN